VKWLITGASGQLGRTLAEFLKAKHLDVVALGRDSLDISDISAIDAVISEVHADMVINCAAWTDVDGAESEKDAALKTNALGPQYLAKRFKESGARFIHISTDFVFGADEKDVYLESDPQSPVNYYGESKAIGENLVLAEYPEAIILRAAWLYSPYGKNFPKAIIRKLITNSAPLNVVIDQVGQPTSCLSLSQTIFDLAARTELAGAGSVGTESSGAESALQVLARAALSGIFHGAAVGQVSRFDFAQAIAQEIGEDPNRILPTSSYSLDLPAIRPNRSVLGHSRHQEAGIELPLDWQTDLKRQALAIKAQVELEL
jgi:dTDP-4-dehydrorhamnose reductase